MYWSEFIDPSTKCIPPTPFPHHTAPDHDGATAELDHQPDKLAVEASILNPTELLTIWSKEVDLHLIRPYHILPILNSNVLVLISKFEMGFAMSLE